eukprot:3426528-Ditylum_brightwellii.AAC.1
MEEASEDNTKEKIDWKTNLSYCTDEILDQMTQHITQYFPHIVEAENHDYTQQHHQKWLFMLHLCRLKGQI